MPQSQTGQIPETYIETLSTRISIDNPCENCERGTNDHRSLFAHAIVPRMKQCNDNNEELDLHTLRDVLGFDQDEVLAQECLTETNG